MPEAKRCTAAKTKTLRGLFGERCGKPATAIDWLGRDVCAECHTYSEEAKKDAQSVANMVGDVLKRRAAAKREKGNNGSG